MPFILTPSEQLHTLFANGELKPFIPETVRGKHVFFLHPLQEPDPNIALMLMFLTADALKRASVSGITLVLPYIPYLRQDRKDEPRTPISARLIADLIETNRKVERLITLDIHADQEQGFFSIPVDNISARTVHAEYFRTKFHNNFQNIVVVAPDFGSAVRARRFAQKLGKDVPVSIIDKRRTGPNQIEVIGFIGPSVANKHVIIYDDMIDTGKTIRGAMSEIIRQGALSVCMCATHGIFSQRAEESFAIAGQQIVVAGTIPRTSEYIVRNSAWLSFVQIDELLADAISGNSVSKLST